MRAAIIIALLSACGGLVPAQEPILPPNVAEACARGVECGIFFASQTPECERCVEKLAELYDEREHGEIPPLDSVPCDALAKYAHDTLVSECVARRSFGP